MHHHGVRRECIEPFDNTGGVVTAIGQNGMGHLPSGMNTGICAASSADPNRPAIQFQQSRFKGTLNGREFWLDLPSGIVGAIVLDINTGSPGHGL
jgi:hypothetical protein